MLTIVKIGGNIIDDDQALTNFLSQFSLVPGRKILVHGGGKLASTLGLRLNITPVYIDGRRITDKETLNLVTMVYGGLINKKIVAQLQALGCGAIGLTGADGDIVRAEKRPVRTIDFGYVGDISGTGVNYVRLKSLLDMEMTPVIAPLTHDGKGSMLNTNADTIAQELAKAMGKVVPVQLIYGFEKNGVLSDATDDFSVIPGIDKADFDRLVAEHIVTDGMIPKISNALAAVQAGVSKVVIGNALQLNEMITGKSGTEIS